MRGYGLKFWTFVQTLSQLRKLYGETWTEIPGNAGVVQYFGGTNDQFTAESISKWTGEMTATEESTSSSTNPSQGFGTSTRVYGRPVRYPGQIRTIPDGEQCLLFLGVDGPVTGYMMDRINPDHFPDFIGWPRHATSRLKCSSTRPGSDARAVLKCPKDGRSLRVPTDRGTIKVKCPCGHTWNWSPPQMANAAE